MFAIRNHSEDMKIISIILLVGALAFLFCGMARAQSVGLSITPPLLKIALSPGDHWESSIKVMNVATAGDVTVYGTVVGFKPQGENGQAAFLPAQQGSSTSELSAWVSVLPAGVTIHPAQSAEIPFSIDVPRDAAPGGHYAAILIGTKNFGSASPGATVNVASYLSSLLFVRIAGNVVEDGSIEEFSINKDWLQKPAADFTLRFRNTGNVDLVPQGVITVYNMWGKERGTIPVNQEDDTFGNVLPQSVRKFSFHWESGAGLLDFGRYTAVATLDYGTENRRSDSKEVAFWVVPVVPMAETLLAIAIIIFLLVWSIRRYVGNILRAEMAARHLDPAARQAFERRFSEEVLDVSTGKVLDLRARSAGVLPEQSRGLAIFKRYALFVVLIPVLAAVLLMAISFLRGLGW